MAHAAAKETCAVLHLLLGLLAVSRGVPLLMAIGASVVSEIARRSLPRLRRPLEGATSGLAGSKLPAEDGADLLIGSALVELVDVSTSTMSSSGNCS